MAYGDNISRQAAIDALWAERIKEKFSTHGTNFIICL